MHGAMIKSINLFRRQSSKNNYTAWDFSSFIGINKLRTCRWFALSLMHLSMGRCHDEEE